MSCLTGKDDKNVAFKILQLKYFIPYFLAVFADWLQGPYVYQVYRNYDFSELRIAYLYIAGFTSSMIFGSCVGSIGDICGRKLICILYGIIYSFCCLTKFSPNYGVLMFGRVAGGIATSIFFSGFESWYVCEHCYYKFPLDWLNLTFSKATLGSGFLAIISGAVSYLFADYLHFGPIAPFFIAVPVLLSCSLFVFCVWEEHRVPKVNRGAARSMLSSLKVLLADPCIITLGVVQSIYEGIMYTFVFAWTPVLEVLSPPLGWVFSGFMLSMMVGSKIYSISITKYSSETLLLVTFYISALSIGSVAFLTSSYFDSNRILSIQCCLVAFLFYELSVGMFYPATSYLRGTIIPDDGRTAIINWLRVPTNMITIFTLFFIKNEQTTSANELAAIHTVFLVCTFFLVCGLVLSYMFRTLYATGMEEMKKLVEPPHIGIDDNVIFDATKM